MYEVATRFKFGNKSLAKRGDDGFPISRASIADLVRPLNSGRSMNSALMEWLPKSDRVSHIDESKFRFSHQRALQQQNFPAPPSSLITLRAARKTWQSKSRQGRIQEGISEEAQIKAQENHVRGEVVMSLRRAILRVLQTRPAATDGSRAASFTD